MMGRTCLSHSASAWLPGWIPAALAAAVAAGPLAADAQITIQGFVRDASGAPIALADLDVFEAQNGTKLDLGDQDDNTDFNGFFSLSLSPDIYHVRAEPPLDRDDLAPFQHRDIVAATSLSLDFVLPAGSRFRGRAVTPDGRPVPNVDLDLIDPVTGVKAATVRDDTDSDGRFAFTVIPGTWHVAFGPPRDSGAGPLRVDAVDLSGDATLDVTLPRGWRLTGTVRTPAGAPVFRADLDARDRTTRRPVPTTDDATDFSGSFDVLLAEGLMDVFIVPPPTAPFASYAAYGVRIDADLDLGAITLPTGHAVSGTIRGPGGTPAAGADLDFFVAGSCDPYPLVDGVTDGAGGFATRVAAGAYDVLVIPVAGAPWIVADVAVAADGPLDLSVSAGTSEARVATEIRTLEGAPVESARIEAVALESGQDWSALSGPDGRVSADIQPGAYAVTVSTDEDESAVIPRVFLPCGLPETVVVSAPVTPSLSPLALRNWPNPWEATTGFSVSLASGASDARLTVYNAAGRRVRRLHDGPVGAGTTTFLWDGTDDSGRPVSSGIYFVRFDEPGGARTTKTARIKP